MSELEKITYRKQNSCGVTEKATTPMMDVTAIRHMSMVRVDYIKETGLHR